MSTTNHPHPVVFHRLRHLFGKACGICFDVADYPDNAAKDTFDKWWEREPLRGAKIRIGPKVEVFLDPSEKTQTLTSKELVTTNTIAKDGALSLVKVVVKRIKPLKKKKSVIKYNI